MGENRNFLVAFSILFSAVLLCLVMLAYQTTAAHADGSLSIDDFLKAIDPPPVQEPCPLYQDLKAMLLKKFNEVPSGSGIAEKGNAAIVVFASPDGATWSIAHIGPDGRACPVAVGEDWLEVIPPKAPIEGERPA